MSASLDGPIGFLVPTRMAKTGGVLDSALSATMTRADLLNPGYGLLVGECWLLGLLDGD